MAPEREEWRPGSFTKNFSWGEESGLKQLHDSIRVGFGGRLQNVSREEFRDRVAGKKRPAFIPINFFLFNKEIEGEDHLIVDELVFQAVTSRHSPRFDKLALFAFNFSYVGEWKGAQANQRRPALWAHRFVRDHVAGDMDWNFKRVSANEIETFVSNDRRYLAEGTRKLSTNLAHLYKIGRLADVATPRVERWWVDALFLGLDRILADRQLDGVRTTSGNLGLLLDDSGFADLTGKRSIEKTLATGHLVRLYNMCGRLKRFSEEAIEERTQRRVQDLEEWVAANEPDPKAAIHPTNPRILKTIPPWCAMLAKEAGFDVLSAMELKEFDEGQYVRRKVREALANLREAGVEPTMSIEDLMRLTRGR